MADEEELLHDIAAIIVGYGNCPPLTITYCRSFNLFVARKAVGYDGRTEVAVGATLKHLVERFKLGTHDLPCLLCHGSGALARPKPKSGGSKFMATLCPRCKGSKKDKFEGKDVRTETGVNAD